jgi:hypothetical protein
MKNNFKLCSVYICLLFVISCKDDRPGDTTLATNSDEFFNYYLNSKIMYMGDSIIYNDFINNIDTIEFMYKDSVLDIDTIGDQIVYRFERFISYDDVKYTYLKNYTISKSKSIGILKNEELRNNYLLPYLFTKDSRWNGNQYQTGLYQEYYIDSLGTVNFANGIRKKVKVIQLDKKNLIEEYKTEEHYVQGIGISYGYYKSVKKDISSGEIKSGSIVTLAHKQ